MARGTAGGAKPIHEVRERAGRSIGGMATAWGVLAITDALTGERVTSAPAHVSTGTFALQY